MRGNFTKSIKVIKHIAVNLINIRMKFFEQQLPLVTFNKRIFAIYLGKYSCWQKMEDLPPRARAYKFEYFIVILYLNIWYKRVLRKRSLKRSICFSQIDCARNQTMYINKQQQ